MAGHVTFEEEVAPPRAEAETGVQRALALVNRLVFTLSAIALVVASAIMTYGVVVRHGAGVALVWQDELCIFLLVGATFFAAASVQARRGHVAIEAVAALLSPRANYIRLLFVDLFSALFCAFFTWKSWTLLEEAWSEGRTSDSAWGPPLWIPYLLMSLGMTLLTAQILLQFADGLSRYRGGRT